MCHEWSPACAVQDAASGNDFTARATLSCETTAQGVYHHRMVPGMSWNLLEFDFNADSFRFCWGPGFSAASFEPPNCNCNESWPRFG